MIALAFIISILANYLLIRYSHLHAPFTGDTASGPQKFHAHPVSRIGGLGVLTAVAGAIIFSEVFLGQQGAISFALVGSPPMLLLACSLIAFAGGFAEDIFKNVGVKARLGATMLAAAAAYFVLDGAPDRLGVAGLDFLLQFGLGSFVFALLAVGGIANAINIVDGYNGLAGVVVVFILAAIAYVAHLVGDSFIFDACLVLIGAVGGFLVWNFPRGKIFLGDGGAYFIGFMIGELSVLLVRQHPEVSPWFPLMLVAYPVWETFYSIFRKKFVRGQSPGDPDGMHFHMLVYKRVVRWKLGSGNPDDRVIRNSLTSPYLWLLSLFTIIPAVLFWDNTVVLAFLAFGFSFFYNWLYNRMVIFRVPKWLIITKH